MADNENLRVGTYTQKAWTLQKGSFISLKDQPCKVSDAFDTKNRHFTKFDFRAHNIFDGTEISHSFRSNDYSNVNVPYVNHTYYKIRAISKDGLLTLVTEKDDPKKDHNLRLPPTQPGVDDDLLTRTKEKLEKGKNLVVEVVSSMGREKIIAVKEVLQDWP